MIELIVQSAAPYTARTRPIMETYSGAAYLVMIGFLLRSNSPTPATSISRSYVYIRRSVVSKGSNQEIPVAPARTVPFGKRRNISIERRKRSLSPRLAASRKSEFSQTSAWLYGKQVNTLARRWCSSAWWVKYLGGGTRKEESRKEVERNPNNWTRDFAWCPHWDERKVQWHHSRPNLPSRQLKPACGRCATRRR
jgi:hypothetical protein